MAITDAQYLDWLDDDNQQRVLLVEAKYYSGSEQTEYMATRGYITESGDTPASTDFDEIIRAVPNFRRSMNEAFNGKTKQSFGDIVIDNSGGVRDDWLERSWNGRDLIMKLGDPSWDFTDFRTIMSGSIAEITASSLDTLILKIRDKGVFLEKQLQETLFTTGPSNDKPLPVCYGEVYNIGPILEDGATHKYKMADGTISAISTVYDQGVSVATTDTLSTASFTLAAQPAGKITADILGLEIASINDDPAATNLTLRSEEADNGSWTKTRSSIAADSLASPDGTTTADSLIEDGTASSTHFMTQSVTVSNATVYAQSVFAKAGTRTLIWVGDDIANAATVGVWFNLATGAVGTQRAGWVGTIEDYGFGWYRCSVVGTSTSTTWKHDVALADTDASISYSGDSASLAYVWGQQLELTALTAYIVTTTATVTRPLTAYRDDIASIVWDIIKTRSDLGSSDTDIVSFQAFKLRHPQKVGIYITGKEKFSQVLDKLVSSVGGYWGFSREGKVTLGVLIDPTGGATSTITLVSDDIIQDGMRVKKRQLPRYRVTLGYKPYQTVQNDSDLAGAVSEDTRADLREPYRLDISEDLSVQTTHLLAHESAVIGTQLADSTEAATEGDRRLALRDQTRTTYLVETFTTTFAVELGDVITVDHDRFGFDGGVKAVVIGYSESINPPIIKLDLWR